MLCQLHYLQFIKYYLRIIYILMAERNLKQMIIWVIIWSEHKSLKKVKKQLDLKISKIIKWRISNSKKFVQDMNTGIWTIKLEVKFKNQNLIKVRKNIIGKSVCLDLYRTYWWTDMHNKPIICANNIRRW